MAETFYSVLGVDPEAETERIQSAYRELVKTHHPDVSDNDDAVEQFKRITKARDVLTDESSRKRYDRVGHNTYVRRYMDGDAWTVDHNTSSSRSTGTGTDSSRSRTTRGSTGGRSSSSSSTNSGSGPGGQSRSGRGSSQSSTNYERYRSQYTPDDSMGADGSTSGNERAWTEDIGAEDFSSSEDGFNPGANDFTWQKENPSTSASGATGSSESTRADGWKANHTATDGYTPSGREPSSSPADSGPGVVSFQSALRQIGPWLVFHFVFLVSAFVTILLLISWTASIPTVFLSLVLLGGAVFFSVLHMISRIYS